MFEIDTYPYMDREDDTRSRKPLIDCDGLVEAFTKTCTVLNLLFHFIATD
jgi:hypothetical protein